MLKGLILKDIYSVKFQIFASILLFLFPNFLLFCFTIRYSEGTGEPGPEWFLTLIYAVISFSSIIIGSSFFINTVSEDVSCGWCKIAGTMPLTVRMICGSKILSSFFILALLTFLSLLMSLFGVFMGVGNAEILIAAPICTMFLQMTALSPVFPFALRFGSKTATPFYLCFLIVIAAILAAAAIASVKCGVWEALRTVFYGGIPAATVLSVFLSLRLSKKMLIKE